MSIRMFINYILLQVCPLWLVDSMALCNRQCLGFLHRTLHALQMVHKVFNRPIIIMGYADMAFKEHRGGTTGQVGQVFTWPLLLSCIIRWGKICRCNYKNIITNIIHKSALYMHGQCLLSLTASLPHVWKNAVVLCYIHVLFHTQNFQFSRDVTGWVSCNFDHLFLPRVLPVLEREFLSRSCIIEQFVIKCVWGCHHAIV